MTFISQLEHNFGITGAALNWMRSYLYQRRSFVRWKGSTPDWNTVDTGVPQGSSLGTELFAMYVAPLAGLMFHYLPHSYSI